MEQVDQPDQFDRDAVKTRVAELDCARRLETVRKPKWPLPTPPRSLRTKFKPPSNETA